MLDTATRGMWQETQEADAPVPANLTAWLCAATSLTLVWQERQVLS